MTLAESTVLVVDDEPLLRLTFSALLQGVAGRVLIAEDGVAALQLLKSERVDVILTDKQMPNMDGATLLFQLREQGSDTPAILFVNSVLPEDAQEMKRLGVVQTVTKPIHPLDLVRLLEAVLAPITAAPL